MNKTGGVSIREVGCEGDLALLRALFREYANSLEIDLCFQGFESELAGLPGDYAPPAGRLLLARVADDVAGCGALHRWSEGAAEMKRLYVRPRFRGGGIGRALANRLVEEARLAGYPRLLLDTLPSMGAAISLYRSLGFEEVPPYRENPVPGALFFAVDLGA